MHGGGYRHPMLVAARVNSTTNRVGHLRPSLIVQVALQRVCVLLSLTVELMIKGQATTGPRPPKRYWARPYRWMWPTKNTLITVTWCARRSRGWVRQGVARYCGEGWQQEKVLYRSQRRPWLLRQLHEIGVTRQCLRTYTIYAYVHYLQRRTFFVLLKVT